MRSDARGSPTAKLSMGSTPGTSSIERHQPLGDARLLGEFDQVLAALLLLDFRRARQQRFEIAIFGDELRAGLHADARNARNVIDRIARQRLHVDHPVRLHAEFLEDFRLADLAVLHCVVERDALAHELHQVLVGGYDAAGGARLDREARISGDQIVGLIARQFDGGHIEGAGGVADQPELRPEIRRRLRPLGLVLGIDFVAKRLRGLVEDDGEMGRLLVRLHVLAGASTACCRSLAPRPRARRRTCARAAAMRDRRGKCNPIRRSDKHGHLASAWRMCGHRHLMPPARASAKGQ